MGKRIATLMYHELSRPGQPLCEAARGYAKYCVAEHTFGDQMRRLVDDGFAVVSVGEMLRERGDRQVVALTFDDGCATDLLVAAPLLASMGIRATSYVTTGFLGRRGFLTAATVRELADAGIEIGSHGMTHRFLPDLSDAELHEEVRASRERLEHMVGRPVDHFSCPGGRFDNRVAASVRAASYRSMATSRIGRFQVGADAFAIPRVVVTERTSVSEVVDIARGRGLVGPRLRASLLDATKRALGNRRYVALRARLFSDGEEPADDSR